MMTVGDGDLRSTRKEGSVIDRSDLDEGGARSGLAGSSSVQRDWIGVGRERPRHPACRHLEHARRCLQRTGKQNLDRTIVRHAHDVDGRRVTGPTA